MVKNQIESTDLNYIVHNAFDALSRISNKRLLITGGAGFLGYYLIKTISLWNQSFPQKISLTVIDNFTLNQPAWINSLDSNIKVETLDISKPFSDKLLEQEYIMHAASIASPSFYRRFPLQTIKANVFGLQQLLEGAAQKKTCEGMLFFSTSEIYGNPEAHAIPTLESYPGKVSCTGPRACYDESKRFGETLCVNYHKAYDLPIKVVRPFNNYGPGLSLNDKRVIPDFANNILNGEDITLFSHGDSTRTFCYVADAIVGYFKALVFGRPGEAYNIGTETPEISMRTLAKIMCDIAQSQFDYQGTLRFLKHPDQDYLTDNPDRRCPDITKARTELQYHPEISLKDGLRRTLCWYQTQVITA